MTATAAQGRTLFAVHAAAGLMAVAVFSGIIDLPYPAGIAALAVMLLVRGPLQPSSLPSGWLVVGGLTGTFLALLSPSIRFSALSSGALAGASSVLGPPLVIQPVTSAVALGLLFVFGVLAASALLGRSFRVPGPFDPPPLAGVRELSVRLDLHESLAISAGLASVLVGPSLGPAVRGPADLAGLVGVLAFLVVAAFSWASVRWLAPRVRRRVGGPSWAPSRWAVLVGAEVVLALLIWVGR